MRQGSKRPSPSEAYPKWDGAFMGLMRSASGGTEAGGLLGTGPCWERGALACPWSWEEPQRSFNPIPSLWGVNSEEQKRQGLQCHIGPIYCISSAELPTPSQTLFPGPQPKWKFRVFCSFLCSFIHSFMCSLNCISYNCPIFVPCFV